MDDALVLKNHLAEIRKEKGLSQIALAKLAMFLCVALEKKFEEIFYF